MVFGVSETKRFIWMYLQMKVLIVILLIIGASSIRAQSTSLIKIENRSFGTWEYFLEKDSTLVVRILDNDGILTEIRRYTDISQQREHGEWTEFYSNSSKKYCRIFDNGVPIGKWTEYKRNGKIAKVINYDFILKYSEYDLSPESNAKSDHFDDVVYVTSMPKFKGKDINEFRYFISKRLTLDSYIYTKYEKTGYHKIYVKFSVDSTGTLTNIKVNQSDKGFMEKEAVRVIRESPEWTPGFMKNVPVTVDFTVPVIFVFPG